MSEENIVHALESTLKKMNLTHKTNFITIETNKGHVFRIKVDGWSGLVLISGVNKDAKALMPTLKKEIKLYFKNGDYIFSGLYSKYYTLIGLCLSLVFFLMTVWRYRSLNEL